MNKFVDVYAIVMGNGFFFAGPRGFYPNPHYPQPDIGTRGYYPHDSGSTRIMQVVPELCG